MECIVTGITEMNGTKVCMSLYSLEENRYIRPLKRGINFDECEIREISLYSLVDITPSEDEQIVQYPHCEDINIKVPYFKLIRELTDDEIFEFFAETSYEDTEDIFGEGNLIKQGRTWGILNNTGECSLGTVEVENFEITKNDFNPEKPAYRVSFKDLSGNTYSDVKLVLKATIEEKDNMVGEYSKENEEERIFIRLSLAREWNNGHWEHKMCVLQVSCFEMF